MILYIDTYFVYHKFRFREFLIAFSILIFLIFIPIVKSIKSYSKLNILICTVGLSFTINYFLEKNVAFNTHKAIEGLSIKKKQIPKLVDKEESPVVLIIVDEFSATQDIYRYTKDSTFFNLDKYLKNKGFTVNNNIDSEAVYTVYSLSSMFNFNLHSSEKVLRSDVLGNKVVPKGFLKLISNNLLVDSLSKKNIYTYAYGILDFKKSKNDFIGPWDNNSKKKNSIAYLYKYEFLSRFLYRTVLNKFFQKYQNKQVDPNLDEFKSEVTNALKIQNNNWKKNTF